ncbi:MAG: hypothetical protein ACRCST_04015 [Turicibacter sp.]
MGKILQFNQENNSTDQDDKNIVVLEKMIKNAFETLEKNETNTTDSYLQILLLAGVLEDIIQKEFFKGHGKVNTQRLSRAKIDVRQIKAEVSMLMETMEE